MADGGSTAPSAAVGQNCDEALAARPEGGKGLIAILAAHKELAAVLFSSGRGRQGTQMKKYGQKIFLCYVNNK